MASSPRVSKYFNETEEERLARIKAPEEKEKRRRLAKRLGINKPRKVETFPYVESHRTVGSAWGHKWQYQYSRKEPT